MDTKLIIEIVIAVVAIYLFVRFIVSPVIRIVLGVVIFLFLIYILQKFFGFNIDNALAPFGISLNLNKWITGLNWVFSPLDYYMNKIIWWVKQF
jgi:hypothetical protein